MTEPFVHRIRVRYYECDRQGIVFNAQWFAYFETTLTELCRAAFGSYETMIEEGSDMVVAEARARFLAPARFDEEIDVAFEIERLGSSSMTVAASVTGSPQPIAPARDDPDPDARRRRRSCRRGSAQPLAPAPARPRRWRSSLPL